MRSNSFRQRFLSCFSHDKRGVDVGRSVGHCETTRGQGMRSPARGLHLLALAYCPKIYGPSRPLAVWAVVALNASAATALGAGFGLVAHAATSCAADK